MAATDKAGGQAARIVLEVPSAVDAHAAAALRTALMIAGRPGVTVLVDLTDVDFIDSAGLGVLLSARRRADTDHWTLLVRSPSERVKRVLHRSAMSWLVQA